MKSFAKTAALFVGIASALICSCGVKSETGNLFGQRYISEDGDEIKLVGSSSFEWSTLYGDYGVGYSVDWVFHFSGTYSRQGQGITFIFQHYNINPTVFRTVSDTDLGDEINTNKDEYTAEHLTVTGTVSADETIIHVNECILIPYFSRDLGNKDFTKA